MCLVSRPTPAASPGEVLVEPILVGLCGTDRAIAAARYPAHPGVVLGHEAVGRIAVDTSPWPVGTRVAINPTLWCGTCERCFEDKTNLCLDKSNREIGVSRDGALASLLAVPLAALTPLPNSMPDRRAVLIEPLACVLQAVKRVRLHSSDRLLVLGGGPIGAVLAMVGRYMGVVVFERDAWRRK